MTMTIIITDERYRGTASDSEATFPDVATAEARLSEIFGEPIKLHSGEYEEARPIIEYLFGPDELESVSPSDRVQFCDQCGVELNYHRMADSAFSPWVLSIDGIKKIVCGVCVDVLDPTDEEAPDAD